MYAFFSARFGVPKSTHVTNKEKAKNATLKHEFNKNGINGVKTFLKKELESWTRIKINVAVTGTTGSGKSSFINLIRNIKPSHPDAAKVGASRETTNTCKPYLHPEHENFVVWDLPGVGTNSFPKNGYLEKVDFAKYDFFIIISKDRFTENDSWLAEEITKQKKQFFFVRSNIDTDITNDKRDDPGGHCEVKFLQSVKKNTEDHLKKTLKADCKVFLISNYDKDKYDFCSLNNEMLSSCDYLKRDVLTMLLAAVTREVIDEKKGVLENRIHLVALKITTTSNKDEQKHIFQTEINTYQKQFNIDDKTLHDNKDILLLTDENLSEFQVGFDEFEHDAGIKMKTPTAMRDAMSLWNRIADCFCLSKANKLLYGFSRTALENNLELLYQISKGFFDKPRLGQIVCAVSKE